MQSFLLSLLGKLVCLTAAISLAVPSSSFAAGREKASLPIVRDAEIESLVREYAQPILKAAGLSRSGIETVLVNSGDFNAFVLGRRIFVNTGAITATETPNQLIGILAHEIGHLAGGHQQRLREKLEAAQAIAIVAALLGAGVAAAGAASGVDGAPGVGAGIFSGGANMAQRSILAYQRGEEATADRAAISYLNKTGQSARGLIETFQILDRSNLFSGSQGRTYLSSHPMPRDRIAAIEEAARKSPSFGRADPPALVERHDMARAKIAAYNGGMGAVRRMFAKDPRGLPAAYGDAIATFLAGSTASALQKIDRLIAARPNNPWFHEMRGEILMAAGRGGEAARAYSQAMRLDRSNSGILKAEVGQALVSSGNPADLDKAVELIQAGLKDDPMNALAYRFLAMAYGRMGDVGRAELATAEGYWHGGAFRDAKIFAARAQQKLKPGTPAWRKAQDILSTKTR